MHVVMGTILVVLSFVLGGLPFGYWIAKRAKGADFDIRDWGSNNIGFTNVSRVLGWKVATPVLLLDVSKGFLFAFVCLHWRLVGEEWGHLCMLAAGFGHVRSWVFYLMEKDWDGGKAVATFAGGILALHVHAGDFLGVWMIAVFLLVLAASRRLSLAALCAGLFILGWSLFAMAGSPWVSRISLDIAVATVVWTHRKNIIRLRRGTEPAFGLSAKDDGIPKSAFAAHLIDEEDLAQSRLTAWMHRLFKDGRLSRRNLKWLLAHGEVLELDEKEAIVAKDGSAVRPLLLGVPQLPEEIKEVARISDFRAIRDGIKLLPGNEALRMAELNALAREKRRQAIEETPTLAFLKAAAVHAQRRGAKVLGLGALLSTVGDGGLMLSNWCKARGLTIVIDNGAANTVASALDALEQSAPKPLSECVVGVVGASGIIGRTLIKCLKGRVAEMKAVARDGLKLRDLASEMEVGEDWAILSSCDIIVFATSAVDYLLTEATVGYVGYGTVIFDISRPLDVDDAILKIRPDLKVIRCGLVAAPLPYRCDALDFHFGYIVIDGVRYQLFPACKCQGEIMVLTGDYSHASCGDDVTVEDVEFFRHHSKRLGYRTIVSAIAEEAVFSGS